MVTDYPGCRGLRDLRDAGLSGLKSGAAPALWGGCEP